MNCKPGDLAIIVFAPKTPRLLGHVVEVVGVWNGNDVIQNPWGNGQTWEIRYPDGRLIEGARVLTGVYFEQSRPFNDVGLRPIRPGDLTEDEEANESKPIRTAA